MKRLLLFGAACAVQVGYWRLLAKGFARARRRSEPHSAAAASPLSVVVAARNEADNLPRLRDALLRQTHPHFEVVIVDDASADATADAVRAWAAAHPNVRLLQITAPQPPRKKHALTRGVQATAHALLAFTDADCTPPPTWLSALAKAHAAAPEDTVLIGYGPYRRRTGLLNRLVRYETLVTAFFTAAAVGLDRPYMAVGRNLSYPKALFQRIDGYTHSLQSITGDDDLFVQEVARRKAARVRYLFDPDTFVPSEAPPTWRRWLRQKRRHTSGGRHYARSIQRHLAVFHATNLLLWAAPLLASWPGAGLLAAKLLVQRQALRAAAAAFRERDLLPAQPFLDLLYALYNLLVAPLGLLRMPKRW